MTDIKEESMLAAWREGRETFDYSRGGIRERRKFEDVADLCDYTTDYEREAFVGGFLGAQRRFNK